jgi:DNA-binding MarR family transcriptional regulator
MMTDLHELSDEDYAALADFRHALRAFHAFSEDKAVQQGLTPQQHQALLAIRAGEGQAAGGRCVTVGYVAERLILKPHSATGLVDRLVALGLVERHPSPQDRRQALLRLTPQARAVLARLSATHRDEIRRLRPMLTALLSRFEER